MKRIIIEFDLHDDGVVVTIAGLGQVTTAAPLPYDPGSSCAKLPPDEDGLHMASFRNALDALAQAATNVFPPSQMSSRDRDIGEATARQLLAGRPLGPNEYTDGSSRPGR